MSSTQSRISILKAALWFSQSLLYCNAFSTYIRTKPGPLGDRPKPMTIQLGLKVGIDYRSHRVTDANVGINGQRCIGYRNDANDGTRCQSLLVDGGWCSRRKSWKPTLTEGLAGLPTHKKLKKSVKKYGKCNKNKLPTLPNRGIRWFLG
jgi:hypothetical protein